MMISRNATDAGPPARLKWPWRPISYRSYFKPDLRRSAEIVLMLEPSPYHKEEVGPWEWFAFKSGSGAREVDYALPKVESWALDFLIT